MSISLLIAGAVRAEPSVATVSEADLLARIEAAHPAMARVEADVEAARADVIAAGVRAEPSLALEREEVFPDGGLATSYARLEVPLDVSGRRGRRIDAARAAAAAVAADGSSARVRITVDALRTFTIAAHARLEVELVRGERAALVRAVEIVRKRVAAGAASGYDLQRIELELGAYDDLASAAELALLDARAALAALLGEPGLVDAGSALELPARPAGTSAAAGAVLAARGDYQAARLRARSAERLAAEARRAWVPAVGVSAGAMAQDTGDDTAYGYTVGLSFALPVFDRGQATAARARAARRAADADRRVLERGLPSTLRARHEALVRRIAQAEQFASGQLSRLEPLLRSAETAYREGSGSVVELLDAHAAARSARLRDLALRRDARLAELDLWLVLGRRP